jgi:hypothetical protein
MDLGDQLADAVARGDNLQSIQTLAHLIIKHRAEERRAALGDAS